MSKLELVKNLKQKLVELMQAMQMLDSNTSVLKKRIADGEWMLDSFIEKMQEELQEIRNRQHDFSLQYEELKIGVIPSKWDEIAIQLEQYQKKIEETEKYIEAVAFFCQLRSEEETVQKLLSEKQEKLEAFDIETMNEEQLKNQLECYIWLFQAFYEQNPRKKFSLIYKMFPYFEEEIAMEVQFGTLIVGEQRKTICTEESYEKAISKEVVEKIIQEEKVVEQDETLEEETTTKRIENDVLIEEAPVESNVVAEEAPIESNAVAEKAPVKNNVVTEKVFVEEDSTIKEEAAITLDDVEEEATSDIWAQIEIEKPEDVIVKEDITLLESEESDKANTKFSIKEFKKEIQKQPTWMKIDSLIFAVTCCGYTDSFIEIIRKKEEGFYRSTTERLYKLGYTKRYTVKGYGAFYALASKGVQVFKSKDAISFLNSYLVKKENLYYGTNVDGESEDSTNAAFARLLCYDTHSKWKRVKPDYEFPERKLRLSTDYFTVEFVNAFGEEPIVFVGITSESQEEFESFYKVLKEDYNDTTRFVVASTDREHAFRVAKWIASVVKSKVPVWYYGYFDTDMYDLNTKDVVEVLVEEKQEGTTTLLEEKDEIENHSEEEVVVDLEEHEDVSQVEEVDLEPISEEEQSSTIEKLENVVIANEIVESKEESNVDNNVQLEQEGLFEEDKSSEELYPLNIKIDFKVEDDNSESEEVVQSEDDTVGLTHSELVDDIISNLDINSELTINSAKIAEGDKKNETDIYEEMLVDNKLYCATAYVKALSKTMPQYESVYRQLAYAVNDPMEACTYNSDTIYDVYYNSKCQVSDHYVIAATMRNYFLDQFNYDYSLQQLHSMISGNTVLRNHPAIDRIIYTLLQFKADYHVGMDKYADYREKGQNSWEEKLEKILKEARKNYNNYILGDVKERINHRRFVEMLKMWLSPKDDLGQHLKFVVDNDKEMLEFVRAYLREHYIKDNAEICEENIDPAKIGNEIERYWDKSKERMNSARQTSDLMSELYTNVFKKVHKIVSVMANYVALMDSKVERSDTKILHYYRKIRTPLLEDIKEAKEQLLKAEDTSLENRAGNAVLIATLEELEARLTGTYIEGRNKYFYINFLKNDKVLLDDSFMPVLDDVLELPQFSVTNRMIQHCQEEEMDWGERLESIFNGEDDYGSAQLILQYLRHENIVLENEDLKNFNIEKAIIYPQKDTENKRKSFIEELELAQSYGKIDNTVENIKETMIQIMDTWFAWANETMNYGFFAKILDAFYNKIEKDAQTRAVELEKNLKGYLEQNPDWHENDLVCKTIRQIQDRIAKQNYAAAEDLMNRLVNEDLEVNFDRNQKDYLEEFFEEYDVNYRKTSNSGATLKNLIYSTKLNKDTKGASRLIENWPKGAGVRLDTMKVFLYALGFDIESVEAETPIQGKMDSFFVQLKRPENGRKSNYKHPISAFGSEAEEKGFRIVCIFGKTDASRLIDTFKEIGNAKNTIILLDYALTLADRRTLARKTKTDLTGKIFAVMDRVVLVYLAKHYVDTSVNRMLMSVIMPFASYQPYIDKSADVMPQEMFIGRKNELEKIESPTGVNIVYGGRQLGKTALLRMAQKDIDRDENGDRAVLVSVWKKDYRESAKIISQALYDEGILKTEHITEDWNELARDIKNRLREEQDKIPYFLLMIDEADTFIESCEAINYQPFEALKDIQSIGSGRFKFVVAGLRNIVRFKREAALGNNSVLTHLDSLTVKPFKTMEARELLEVPLSYLGFRFPKNNETEVLISTIFGTTNYFPGLIQLYCTKLIEAMKRDYAGYSESETPPYIVQKELIKKVLAEQTLQKDIREKFFVTLEVGNDDYYYIIALLVANHYHINKSQNGCSAKDVLELVEAYSIQKLFDMNEEQIWALMEEMCELNVLQHTGEGRYRFTRHSFCQMMGSVSQIEDELCNYMED